MKTNMQVVNIGFGSMEGNPWAKAEILDGNVEFVDDGNRVFKGAKTAKINLDTSNNQALGLRLQSETFPAFFELDVDMSIVGGKTQLKILDFKSNIKNHENHGK